LSGDGVSGGVANFLVDSVDALHGEFVNGPDLGNQEMYLEDPHENKIRFIPEDGS
jgi:hypothetical protein